MKMKISENRISDLVYLLVVIRSYSCTAQSTKFKRKGDVALRVSDPYKSVGKASLLECCIHCADESLCSAINYHRETQTCELNEIHSNNAIEENTFGWNVYYKVVNNKTYTNTTCVGKGVDCKNNINVCAAGMAFIAKERQCFPAFGNSYYVFAGGYVKWTKAKDVCLALGGHLLELETKEEHDFIIKYRGDVRNRWIGGHDMNQDDDFTWESSGLRLKDTHEGWCEGKPEYESSYQRCLRLSRKCGYRIAVDKCDNKNKYICEKEISDD